MERVSLVRSWRSPSSSGMLSQGSRTMLRPLNVSLYDGKTAWPKKTPSARSSRANTKPIESAQSSPATTPATPVSSVDQGTQKPSVPSPASSIAPPGSQVSQDAHKPATQSPTPASQAPVPTQAPSQAIRTGSSTPTTHASTPATQVPTPPPTPMMNCASITRACSHICAFRVSERDLPFRRSQLYFLLSLPLAEE